jgi:hypothetical protein
VSPERSSCASRSRSSTTPMIEARIAFIYLAVLAAVGSWFATTPRTTTSNTDAAG